MTRRDWLFLCLGGGLGAGLMRLYRAMYDSAMRAAATLPRYRVD